LRERVIKAWQDGKTQGWIAETFSLRVSSIKRYSQRFQTTGSMEPTVQRREQPVIGNAYQATLEALVRTKPDATLAQDCDLWFTQTKMNVSIATMSRSLMRFGLPLKKDLWRDGTRRSSPLGLARTSGNATCTTGCSSG